MKKIYTFLLSVFMYLAALGIQSCLPADNGRQNSNNNYQYSEDEDDDDDEYDDDEYDDDEYDDDDDDYGYDDRKKNDNHGGKINKNGKYTDKKNVALYIHTYGCLPKNYIKKRDAEARGWKSSKGNLHDVAPGMSIGGDSFGNYEGRLPKAKKRKYYECDIDYKGGRRNAKRIIYSNDGLVFYTSDHYKSFKQLY